MISMRLSRWLVGYAAFLAGPGKPTSSADRIAFTEQIDASAGFPAKGAFIFGFFACVYFGLRASQNKFSL
jgi:hypothetical protein